MAYLNKHAAHKMEQQYLKDTKHFFLRIQNLNQELHVLLVKTEREINKSKYDSIIEYINQYVVHTDIWRLRFTNNLQNIEIAVLQVLLLEHIYQQDPTISQTIDHEKLEEFKEQLLLLNDHAPKLFEIHRKKLQNYISES